MRIQINWNAVTAVCAIVVAVFTASGWLTDGLHEDIKDLRQEMREEFAETRQEMREGFTEMRQEMREGFTETREGHRGTATGRGFHQRPNPAGSDNKR